MKNRSIIKYLSVGVVILFVTLAFAPSINANTQSDFVEFTTEVCGMNGGKQTVKLTRQQADEVEALFNSIREQLNATESREDAEEIFKDAVVELDKYGLLGDLSIKQAQKLVTGTCPDQKIKNFLADRNHGNLDNRDCLTAGDTTYHYFLSLGSQFINYELYNVIASFYQWIDDNFFLILPSITQLILMPFVLILELMDFSSFIFSNFLRPPISWKYNLFWRV